MIFFLGDLYGSTVIKVQFIFVSAILRILEIRIDKLGLLDTRFLEIRDRSCKEESEDQKVARNNTKGNDLVSDEQCKDTGYYHEHRQHRQALRDRIA